MRVDFVGRKKVWFLLSLGVIVLGMTAVLVRGLEFGIEFKGGTAFAYKFPADVSIAEVREALKKQGVEESIIQPLGEDQTLIRTVTLAAAEEEALRQGLAEDIGGELQTVETVGPGWGRYITERAILALVVSVFALLIYTSIRFEFKMAVAVIIALLHDILVTVGVYALVGRQVTPNTVAAILTILGYSIYDTVVVFHRIRENTAKITKKTYSEVVNISENEVLMRSINTSLTTLFPIMALLLVGGETLKDFAFALLIGVSSGSYSSLFTASPFLAWWKEREPRYQALQARLAQAQGGAPSVTGRKKGAQAKS